MKKSPSLFQVAAKKYTTFSADLKDAKKVFLEQLTSTQPATTASAPPSAGGTEVPPGTSGSEKTTGSENPPTLASLAPGQKSEQAQAPGAGMAAPAIDLMDPDTEVKEFDGKTMAFNKNVPGQAMILNPEQVAAYKAMKTLAPQNEAVEKENTEDHTTGDILGPLSTLSRGPEGLKETDNMGEMDDSDITEVTGPAKDTLVSEDEDDGNAPSGTEMEGESEGTAEPATSSSPEMGHPQSMGMSSPSAGLARNQASSSNTGDKDSASSFQTDEPTNEVSTEKSPGETTGVSGDYTTEAGKEGEEGKEDTTQTSDTTGKEFAKGAGDATEKDSGALGPALQNTSVNAGTTNKNASANSEMEGENGITDPNAKEDAFWVPGDDEGFGGLKDVVSTVAQKAGVPDGQTAIVKDPATGALVKRPTMPPHAIPNMRQYVKTNGVPGAPSVLGAGMGHNPVDISDLDGVMGMDTASDRALNISLNFNF